MVKKLGYLCCFIWSFWACERDTYFGPVYTSENSSKPDTVVNNLYLIGCEGNFQLGNASISTLDLENMSINNEVFNAVNQNQIGDVLQSFMHIGDSIFLVLNNSNMVRIINDSTFEQIAIIEDVISPRYMKMVDKNHAILTTFGGQKLYIVNVHNLVITAEIDAPRWTERIACLGQSCWVSDMSDSNLLSLNTISFNIEAKISLPIEPQFIASNFNDIIIAGNRGKTAQILVYDGSEIKQLKSWDANISGFHLFQNHAYLAFKRHLEILNISTGESVRFNHNATAPYGIYADSNFIIMCDVKDYVSRGEVLVYNHENELVDVFVAGYIPQAVIKLN